MTKGELIRTARKQAGLTQKQLSEIYEIPLRTIEDWEGERRNPATYVVNLLLRCLVADYPSGAKELSEQITKPTEPIYVFYDEHGKSLESKLAKLVKTEYLAGRVQEEQDKYIENSYGDLVPTATNKRGRLYQCTEIGMDSEIPFAFKFRVKEV